VISCAIGGILREAPPLSRGRVNPVLFIVSVNYQQPRAPGCDVLRDWWISA